jgi:hypothetical protein
VTQTRRCNELLRKQSCKSNKLQCTNCTFAHASHSIIWHPLKIHKPSFTIHDQNLSIYIPCMIKLCTFGLRTPSNYIPFHIFNIIYQFVSSPCTYYELLIAAASAISHSIILGHDMISNIRTDLTCFIRSFHNIFMANH